MFAQTRLPSAVAAHRRCIANGVRPRRRCHLGCLIVATAAWLGPRLAVQRAAWLGAPLVASLAAEVATKMWPMVVVAMTLAVHSASLHVTALVLARELAAPRACDPEAKEEAHRLCRPLRGERAGVRRRRRHTERGPM